MSTNKYKYFEVTSTKIVRALNKADAMKAASVRKPVVNTKVLTTSVSAERISATDAHYLAEQLV